MKYMTFQCINHILREFWRWERCIYQR